MGNETSRMMDAGLWHSIDLKIKEAKSELNFKTLDLSGFELSTKECKELFALIYDKIPDLKSITMSPMFIKTSNGTRRLQSNDLPKEFFELRNLEIVKIEKSELEIIPADIANLRFLKELHLGANWKFL